MSRVALVTNLLAHYRVKGFRLLKEMLHGKITFYLLTGEMEHRRYVIDNREADLPAVWLSGRTWHRPPSDDKHLNDISPLTKENGDILILGGWDEPSYFMLWFWGVLRRKKIIFWIESTAFERDRRGLKEAYKKVLLKYAKGCIVPGDRASDYCVELGMDPEQIFRAPNATDGAFYANRANELRQKRSVIRNHLGIEGVIILFVGRLVEEYKGVSTLIEAFSRLKSKEKSVNLVVVGDGPSRTSYESLAKNLNVRNVYFLGEMNVEQLSQVYSVADIQVLPSRCEPWGFVLNEGMEFGLPLVVSEAVGAGADLVRPGENGFVFPVGKSDKLAEILQLLVRDESLRKRMGEKSKEIIRDFTPEAWAEGVVKAIEAVTGKTV